MNVCQSCGMPMAEPTHFGTNTYGSQNKKYCAYCYKNGAFTEDMTMDEMIEHCAQFVDEFNVDASEKMTKEQAIAGMKEHFPMLERWERV